MGKEANTNPADVLAQVRQPSGIHSIELNTSLGPLGVHTTQYLAVQRFIYRTLGRF
jgi:hypothetical protein